MTRDEERSVIDRVLRGDVNAFEGLVLAHQKNVYNLALKMLGDPDAAFDASQDTFLRAYNSLSSFRGDSRFSVWLYRLTSNICLDHLRKKKRRREVSLTREEEEPELPDSRPLPEQTLLRKEADAALREGLSRLPDNDREILTLRAVAGLSYEEIAALKALELGTVKSRLFRARKRLLAFLQESGNYSPRDASNHRKGV